MKAQEKTEMMRRILLHGENLLTIFPNATEQDPYKLCSKLRSYEAKATRMTEAYCNTGDLDEAQLEAIHEKVLRLLNATPAQAEHIFINRDPRGYALKIKDSYMYRAKIAFLHRDMGGYGILAPDYTPNN